MRMFIITTSETMVAKRKKSSAVIGTLVNSHSMSNSPRPSKYYSSKLSMKSSSPLCVMMKKEQPNEARMMKYRMRNVVIDLETYRSMFTK